MKPSQPWFWWLSKCNVDFNKLELLDFYLNRCKLLEICLMIEMLLLLLLLLYLQLLPTNLQTCQCMQKNRLNSRESNKRHPTTLRQWNWFFWNSAQVLFSTFSNEYKSTHDSIHNSPLQSIHPSDHSSIHASIHPSTHPSIRPPIHLSIIPSIHQPIYQSIQSSPPAPPAPPSLGPGRAIKSKWKKLSLLTKFSSLPVTCVDLLSGLKHPVSFALPLWGPLCKRFT